MNDSMLCVGKFIHFSIFRCDVEVSQQTKHKNLINHFIFRELQDGTLEENGIINGSKIIVTPNVETGLVSVMSLTFSVMACLQPFSTQICRPNVLKTP